MNTTKGWANWLLRIWSVIVLVLASAAILLIEGCGPGTVTWK